MSELLEKGLAAKRESKFVEFKESFDPKDSGDWCEIAKDIVAIANTGGGIILIGLSNVGGPTNSPEFLALRGPPGASSDAFGVIISSFRAHP